MTEETKELINCIRVNLRHNKCFGGIDEIECKLLLDCITNLQQENESLKQLNENASKVCVAEHKYGVEKAEEARDYKSRLERASNKLDSMFANGEENKALDDLLELDKIVKGDKQ